MSTAAESVRRYSRFFKSQQAMDVLDYGTGSMRNAVYLAQEGFSVYAADLPEQVERLRNCPALMHVERLLATDELPRSNLNVGLVLSKPIQPEKSLSCPPLPHGCITVIPRGFKGTSLFLS